MKAPRFPITQPDPHYDPKQYAEAEPPFAIGFHGYTPRGTVDDADEGEASEWDWAFVLGVVQAAAQVVIAALLAWRFLA
jgi:hypothetical protein